MLDTNMADARPGSECSCLSQWGPGSFPSLPPDESGGIHLAVEMAGWNKSPSFFGDSQGIQRIQSMKLLQGMGNRNREWRHY